MRLRRRLLAVPRVSVDARSEAFFASGRGAAWRDRALAKAKAADSHLTLLERYERDHAAEMYRGIEPLRILAG